MKTYNFLSRLQKVFPEKRLLRVTHINCSAVWVCSQQLLQHS